jgi:ferredoxin, 2Fe-2S
MPMVHWVLPNGSRHSDDLPEGSNLMDAAQLNGIKGIAGECGGCLSCATCHVVVESSWLDKCPEMSAVESILLNATSALRQEGSRLSCQLTACAALDGVVMHVPA